MLPFQLYRVPSFRLHLEWFVSSFRIRYEHNFSIWEYFGLLRGGAPATDFLANDYAQMMLRDCVARGNLSTDTACTMPKSDMGEWTFSQNVLTQTHSEANPERNSFVHTPHNPCHSEAFMWLLKPHCFAGGAVQQPTVNLVGRGHRELVSSSPHWSMTRTCKDEWTEIDVSDLQYGRMD